MNTVWILFPVNPHRLHEPITEEDFVFKALNGVQWMYSPISGREGATKPLFWGALAYVLPDTWSKSEAEDFILLTGSKAHQIEFTDEDYETFISAISFGLTISTVNSL